MTIAWTIAGSDSGGSAGIQADLRTFNRLGVHGCSVVTAVTAQNSHVVQSMHVLPFEKIQSQIDALKNDLHPQAIKIGMLGNVDIVQILRLFLNGYQGHAILDPVFISSSGNALFQGEKQDYLLSLQSLFPYVTLLTPNIQEAESFFNTKIESFSDIKQIANEFLSLGVKNVLIKGGHFKSDFCHDYWTNGQESFWLNSKRLHGLTRGTGCTLSSAITASLALGYDIKDALVIGKMYVTQGIRHAKSHSLGQLSLAHVDWPMNQDDLPYLTNEPLMNDPIPFSAPGDLGVYPIVDHSSWIARLLPLGIKTIQLRIKNQTGEALENEIKTSIGLANQFEAKLFINDYWDLALKYQAYGVHLGQEDIETSNIEALKTNGIRLGLSSHCYYEVARAHAINPSYIACGPIFATTSKEMSFAPQGLEKLAIWQRTLNYPLVAIGGINFSRFQQIRAMNVNGIAMISAITQAENPEQVTRDLLAAYNAN